MTRRRALSLAFTALAAALLLTTGCNDKDDPQPPVPEYALPFPDTPDQVVANFRTVLTDLDVVAYRDEVLADEYAFILLDETVEEFALPDGIFDRDEELTIAQNMFSGQENAQGGVLTDIEVPLIQPQGAWTTADADPDFRAVPGGLVRAYNVLVYFNMRGDFRYEVRGQQFFCVIPDTQLFEGAMTPCYRLQGQRDGSAVGAHKATESSSWGGVKALFR